MAERRHSSGYWWAVGVGVVLTLCGWTVLGPLAPIAGVVVLILTGLFDEARRHNAKVAAARAASEREAIRRALLSEDPPPKDG